MIGCVNRVMPTGTEVFNRYGSVCSLSTEYREDIAEIQAGSYVDQKPEEEVLPDDNEEEKKRQPKKEFYVKTIVLLLWQVVRFLDPKAISHRKMLIRYIAKNQIHLNQMGTVLWYLRKVGNGILDQEEFEKICGIGNQIAHLKKLTKNRRAI